MSFHHCRAVAAMKKMCSNDKVMQRPRSVNMMVKSLHVHLYNPYILPQILHFILSFDRWYIGVCFDFLNVVLSPYLCT